VVVVIVLHIHTSSGGHKRYVAYISGMAGHKEMYIGYIMSTNIAFKRGNGINEVSGLGWHMHSCSLLPHIADLLEFTDSSTSS
jgi:hypothetical protein